MGTNNTMTRIISYFVITASLLISSLASQAQTIFDVELVFFKRLDATGQFNYLAKEDNSVSGQTYTLNSPISLPSGYQNLQRSERKLEGVFRRLRSSANMRPLLHLGWRQPLTDKEDTPWMSFRAADDPEKAGLLDFIGNIRFSRNQGLLVEALISGFRAADPSVIIEETDEQMPDQLAGYFLLEENRKIKINKLNYFDNPTMGILIKVTPYQATLEEQEALEAEQALIEKQANNEPSNKDS